MSAVRKSIYGAMLFATVFGGAAILDTQPVAAQDAAYMSCGELWYARNTIYARRGYCFKSERAISAFGPGCFPPYGRLDGWEKDRVDELQMWERRKGCGY
jgi:hypothetical protein